LTISKHVVSWPDKVSDLFSDIRGGGAPLDYNRFKYSLLVDLVEIYLSSVDRADVFGAERTEMLWWWPEPEGFFSSS
jgi:hypothetical protein